MNPDFLRVQPKAVAFVKAFFDANKPVASICHGPWTIIETGAARGTVITSWPSLKTDLRNAGQSGSIKKSWSMATWSPVANRMISRRSTQR
jgi:putative intracellular protease/amidase